MNQLLSGFINYIKKEKLFQRHDKLLVAVSGGVDSSVLCDLCYEAAYDFAIAHCNFQLRGEESERDEAFVASLAKKYKVPLFTKKFDTTGYTLANKVSVQVAARDMRYAWFRQLIGKNEEISQQVFPHEVVILTAHHSNDNVETVLMNFFKGTGMNGLTGIAPKQGKLIRPLLFATKDEIKEYAVVKELEYVEDSSNESNKYTRNYFRNELIPGVQKVFPMVEQNLINNIDRFREAQVLYQQAVELHKSKLVTLVKGELHMPVMKLLKTVPLPTLLYEILKDYDFSPGQIPEVMHLLKSETGKLVQSTTHRVIRNRDWLIVSPIDSKEAANIVIQSEDEKCEFDEGMLYLKKRSNRGDFISANEQTACVDLKQIVFPLILRKWKPGDYFYPLGMRKKKKVSKFLSDLKLSVTDKEKVWVVESGDLKIVWIVGLRIDDRFKVTDKTEEVLRMAVEVE